ncbi:hypothetical protein D3C77_665740 [compost metagenome]
MLFSGVAGKNENCWESRGRCDAGLVASAKMMVDVSFSVIDSPKLEMKIEY